MTNNIDINNACIANIVREIGGIECVVFVSKYTRHAEFLAIVDIDDACIVARDRCGHTYTIAIEFDADTYRFRMLCDIDGVDLTSDDGITWG